MTTGCHSLKHLCMVCSFTLIFFKTVGDMYIMQCIVHMFVCLQYSSEDIHSKPYSMSGGEICGLIPVSGQAALLHSHFNVVRPQQRISLPRISKETCIQIPHQFTEKHLAIQP